MADAVYSMSERHLQSCELLPAEERLVIQQAVRIRQASQAEGGPSWQEEEGNRRVLVDFLKMRCFQLGIMNRYPENSGICFAEPEEPAQQQQQQPQYTQQQAPETERQEASPPHRSSPPQPHRSSPQEAAAAAATLHHHLHHGHSEPEALYAAAAVAAAAAAPPPMDPHPHHHVQALVPPPYAPPTYLSPEALAMRHAAASMDPHPHAAAAMYQGHPVPPPPPFELPANYPYFQDPYEGDWLCKYCSHVHPQYRDPNYRWSTPQRTPPPGDFIDHHLSICRAYLDQQQQMSEYHQQQQHHERFAATEAHSPYPYGHNPQVVYSTTAAGYPPILPNPEVSPMTPATAYAPPYEVVGLPPPGVSMHPHDVRSSSYAQAPPPAPLSPSKMGPVARKAIQFLVEHDRFAAIPDEDNLVRQEDKLLLTDFLFYLMKQLTVVRFSECDRKTRGGKRENINLGFGGLQCIHCADSQKSRKFYWSGVDRLANSFAEIPSHVFKCKDCPKAIKDALLTLKEVHPDQMSRLPRGSQKVFFRRVWKRIHDDDPPPTPTGDGSPRSLSRVDDPTNPISPAEDTKQPSPSGTTGTSGSDESPFLIERPTKEAAKALADSLLHADSVPLSPSSRILLSIAEDRDFLSEQDCFIRRQLEVFCATSDDVQEALEDSKFPIDEGQVGLRCIHCAMTKHGPGARGNAVVYPCTVNAIFEVVREFQRTHLGICENLPLAWKEQLDNTSESSTISSIQRKYYSLAAKGLGLYDVRGGIRAGSESVPVISQAVFNFSEVEEVEGWRDEELPTDSTHGATGSAGKRKHDGEEGDCERDLKRSHLE